MAELRWNPMLREWIITAADRQDRTFLPPRLVCPLCPTTRGRPTEVTRSDFDVAVFENRFPSMSMDRNQPSVAGTPLAPAKAATGTCEVVVYSPDHDASLSSSSLGLVRRLISVWAQRTVELGAMQGVEYVFIFENRGEAIGVTLHHPHGQIYAYPFVPPLIQREMDSAQSRHRQGDACLWCSHRQEEAADRRRWLFDVGGWSAYVPFFARWPYEVHLVPARHVGWLSELSALEVDGLARAIKLVVSKYDRLFDFALPYVMAVHQRAVRGDDETYHLHLEFMPRHRSATKLKYLAGSEVGAGTFIADISPEDAAARLRSIQPRDPKELTD